MIFATLLALAASVSAGFSSNGLSVIVPGGDSLWWVANSDNNVGWTCTTSKVQTFTMWINNTDRALVGDITPLGNVQNNFDCIHLIPGNQIIWPVGSGYTIFLSDINNVSNVFAISDPFEIKAISAGYPPASATPTAVGTASSTAPSSSGSAQSGNGGSTSSGGNTTSSGGGGSGAGVSVRAGAGAAAMLAAAMGVIGGVVAVM